jgi:hypothetical protein
VGKNAKKEKKIKYQKPARLVWQDAGKLTTGVGYLRGQPEFEGTLVDAIRKYVELPPSSQAFARIYIARKARPESPRILDARKIEAVRKRKDFPKR